MRAPAMLSAAALVAALTVASQLVGPAGAETPRADRYAMTPADGGFLRLDRETGATSFCATRGDGYACAPVQDDAALLQPDAARFEARIAALEEQVRRLGLSLPAVPALPRSGPELRDQSLNLPSEKQMDELASFFERALKRMKRFANEMDKEIGADEQRL